MFGSNSASGVSISPDYKMFSGTQTKQDVSRSLLEHICNLDIDREPYAILLRIV